MTQLARLSSSATRRRAKAGVRGAVGQETHSHNMTRVVMKGELSQVPSRGRLFVGFAAGLMVLMLWLHTEGRLFFRREALNQRVERVSTEPVGCHIRDASLTLSF